MLILIPILISNLHCAVFPFYFVLFLPYIGEYFIAVIADLDLDKRLGILICKIFKLISKKMTKKKEFVDKEDNIKLEIVERKRKRELLRKKPYKILITKNKWVIALIVIMVIAFFTGVINPTGLGAYTYTYKIMQGNTTSSINEHLPLTLIENKEFAIAICIFLVILIFTDTKIKLSDLFMLGGLCFLMLISRRQLSVFAIISSIILGRLIMNMAEAYKADVFENLEKVFKNVAVCITLSVLIILLSYDTIKPKLDDQFVSTDSYPVSACDYILENIDLSNARFYNEYNYGSYMLFRGIPVFIDSRADLYSPEFSGNEEEDIFTDFINTSSISTFYEDTFKKYDITHIICLKKSKMNLIITKTEDDKYKELYSDENFVIYERER
jgi:hypothetical protein